MMSRLTYFFVVLSFILLSGCAKQVITKAPPVFYPEPPQKPRIQYLHSIIHESDLDNTQPTQFELLFLGPEIEIEGAVQPYAVNASKNKVYIVDRFFNKVFVFDLAEKKLLQLSDRSHPDGTPGYTGGIWVTQDGYKYTADIKRKQILVYGPDDKYVGAYGDETKFGKPVDVAVFESNIYVVDLEKNQIVVLDKDTGGIKKTIGEKGPGDSQFSWPTHITLDKSGNLYVTDSMNFKIKKFNHDGEFERSFGFHGDNIGAFARPKGIAVDREGRLYSVDAANQHVQIFDSNGQLLLFFGGSGPKIQNLSLPAGIAIDYENVDYFSNYADENFKIEYLIYVTSMYGPGRTNIYGFGEWIGDSKRLDQLSTQLQKESQQSTQEEQP